MITTFGCQSDMPKDLKAYFVQSAPTCVMVGYMSLENHSSKILIFNRANKELIEEFEFEECKTQIIVDMTYYTGKSLLIVASKADQNEYWISVIHITVRRSKTHFQGKVANLLKTLKFKESIEAIKQFNESFFVAMIGTNLHIFEIFSSENSCFADFQEKLKKNLQLVANQIDVHQNMILICDPFKHITVYKYKQEENKLQFIAKAYASQTLMFGNSPQLPLKCKNRKLFRKRQNHPF